VKAKPTKLITLATLAMLTLNVSAKDFSSEELQQRMLERRAVDALIWGMPIVSLDAMRQTAALFLNLTRPTLDSLDNEMRKNADGSVDIYFGPKAPAGKESNWIYTPAEKSWFPWFRFYGPEKALFDKSWTMPDIEMVKQ
jgi:hypothetical protein